MHAVENPLPVSLFIHGCMYFLVDPYDVVKLFPNLLPQQVRQKTQTDVVNKLEDMDLESGLLALIEYLRKASNF